MRELAGRWARGFDISMKTFRIWRHFSPHICYHYIDVNEIFDAFERLHYYASRGATTRWEYLLHCCCETLSSPSPSGPLAACFKRVLIDGPRAEIDDYFDKYFGLWWLGPARLLLPGWGEEMLPFTRCSPCWFTSLAAEVMPQYHFALFMRTCSRTKV